MKLDEKVRNECVEILKRSITTSSTCLLGKRLGVEYVAYDDWCNAIDIVERYGLLPADAIYVAVALRIRAKAIATFNEDFRVVKEINVIP